MIDRFLQISYAVLATLVVGAILTSQSDPRIDPIRLNQQLGDNVVKVRCGGGHGTGWFASHDGLVITNYHVVRMGTDWRVELTDGTIVPAQLVHWDLDNDTAVLATGLDRKLDFLQLAYRDPIPGEPIVMIGYPRFMERSITVGYVGISPMRDMVMTFDGEDVLLHDRVMFDITGAPGNSGSPILNARGQVIAYLNAGLASEPYGYGIMAYVAIEMIREYRLNGPYDLPPALAKLQEAQSE